MRYISHIESIFGDIGICEENNYITNVFFKDSIKKISTITFIEQKTPLLNEAAIQLHEYLSSTRKKFDLPIMPKGTDFQKKVWAALLTIPFGSTRTYGEIAAQIDCPQSARAVGNANHHNPIAIIIPCHRIIGADGSLVGYASGIDIKEKLLLLEKNILHK